MPNRNEHLNAGFWVLGFVNFIVSATRQSEEIRLGSRQEIDFMEAIGDGIIGGTGGVLGSMIPDIIDPPTNPNHRGRAHSITNLALTAGIIGGNSLSENTKLNIFLKSIVGGNGIHILQDSETPKGIPII